MSTVGSPFAAGEDAGDPNIVKVVRGVDGRALYFSRSLVPFDRDGGGAVAPLKHVGLYCYRVWMLERYAGLAETPLERCEKLEQLRVLEHGYGIAVAVSEARHHGIDTAGQYRAFVDRWRGRGG
jgi:3-deoxy-manno-octulosonate cytidylyltransferase (CMP-KDO synthetase)